jgi:nucleotide-binding universal stress UspA family protein
MPRTIIPVDFSDTSAAALRFGHYLSTQLSHEVHVLHVFDTLQSTIHALSGKARDWEHERLSKRLDAFVATHLPDKASAVRTEVREGDPAQQLVRESGRDETELVVMGGVGAGEGPHAPKIFGTVAQQFVKKGNCPVILLPKGYGEPRVDQLAIAFETVADLRHMGFFTRRLAEALRPGIRLVHVRDYDETAEDKLEDELIELGIGPDFPSHPFAFDALPPGNPVDQLLIYTKRETVGLLVLGGRRRPFLEQLFRRDHLGRLVSRSEVPVLVVPFVAGG